MREGKKNETKGIIFLKYNVFAKYGELSGEDVLAEAKSPQLEPIMEKVVVMPSITSTRSNLFLMKIDKHANGDFGGVGFINELQ